MAWLLYALCAVYFVLALGGLNQDNRLIKLASWIAIAGIAAAAYMTNWWILLVTFVVDHAFQQIQLRRGGPI